MLDSSRIPAQNNDTYGVLHRQHVRLHRAVRRTLDLRNAAGTTLASREGCGLANAQAPGGACQARQSKVPAPKLFQSGLCGWRMLLGGQ